MMVPADRSARMKALWRRRKMLPYEEARRFVAALGLSRAEHYANYVAGRRPDLPPVPVGLPSTPHGYYRGKGFTTWEDFLGVTDINDARGLPFLKARGFVQSLAFRSCAEWRAYLAGDLEGLPALPPGFPRAPQNTYRGSGWCGFNDFLGLPRKRRVIAKEWVSYEEAVLVARRAKIPSSNDWKRFTADGIWGGVWCPRNVPSNPQLVYRGRGWVSWGEFLGTGALKKVWCASFVEARTFARTLGLRSRAEWIDYVKGKLPHLPQAAERFPMHPNRVYPIDEWTCWNDFLGFEIWSLEQSALFVRSLNLGGEARSTFRSYINGEHGQHHAPPAGLPVDPDRAYKGSGWISWGHFVNGRARCRRDIGRVGAPCLV